jgi:hypothetical protein
MFSFLSTTVAAQVSLPARTIHDLLLRERDCTGPSETLLYVPSPLHCGGGAERVAATALPLILDARHVLEIIERARARVCVYVYVCACNVV